MSTTYLTKPKPVQQLEATAALRVLVVEGAVGGSYALNVSKAGAAFVNTSGGSATEINNASGSGTGLFKVQLGQYDCDTLGDLAVELDDGTNKIYVSGPIIVEHDPYAHLYDLWCRHCNTVVADTSDNTIKPKDAAGNVRLTLTKTTTGTQATWTRS